MNVGGGGDKVIGIHKHGGVPWPLVAWINNEGRNEVGTVRPTSRYVPNGGKDSRQIYETP